MNDETKKRVAEIEAGYRYYHNIIGTWNDTRPVAEGITDESVKFLLQTIRDLEAKLQKEHEASRVLVKKYDSMRDMDYLRERESLRVIMENCALSSFSAMRAFGYEKLMIACEKNIRISRTGMIGSGILLGILALLLWILGWS